MFCTQHLKELGANASQITMFGAILKGVDVLMCILLAWLPPALRSTQNVGVDTSLQSLALHANAGTCAPVSEFTMIVAKAFAFWQLRALR